MLYTLITFIGLLIVVTAVAVIYYVKTEEYRDKANKAESSLEEIIKSDEQLKGLGKIVGTVPTGKSALGTMADYLDETVCLIVGGVPETTSAEAKINDVNKKVGNALKSAQEHIDVYSEREQVIQGEKNKLQQQINIIQTDYDELRTRLEKSTTEQVDTYRKQLEEARANLKSLNGKLLKTQAELKMAEDVMKLAQQEVREIKPSPDHEVLAHRPDGKIILIDDQTNVVHLNIGSKQHIYRGLTFTVYDRSGSIPKDGRGKAEIEVFDVAETYSAARITKSETKKPILLGDIVANLIWNSDKTNVFVVAGDFDLDNDGNLDQNAAGKIQTLIEKWGGRVADTISIDTDFLVLGGQPQVPKQQPTFEELELDPGAMQKYEALLQRLKHYNQLQGQAQALWIPVFRYERFLYFIGYKGQISQAGAF